MGGGCSHDGHTGDPHTVGAGQVEERGDLPVGSGGEDQGGRRHIGVELLAPGGGEAGRHGSGVGRATNAGGDPGQIVGRPHRRGMTAAEAVVDEPIQLGERPDLGPGHSATHGPLEHMFQRTGRGRLLSKVQPGTR
jgi:hypothetical protein